MHITNIKEVVFSPTDSTKQIVATLSTHLGLPSALMDITLAPTPADSHAFIEGELAVFGMPVYGGRIPAIAIERIPHFHGHKTPAIIIVTYGNRAYDDALLELKNTIESLGFIVIAAAAFICEHSIMHAVAQGRPDTVDKQVIREFSQLCSKKIQTISTHPHSINVPGTIPYREYKGVPFKPYTDDTCTSCGSCIPQCPVQAIRFEHPPVTNYTLCISCMRCIKICPMQSRVLDEQLLTTAQQSFVAAYNTRREPEIYL